MPEIKPVMSVLERRNADPAGDQPRNELLDQRGFAGTAPAGEADDAHGPLIAKRPPVETKRPFERILQSIQSGVAMAAAGSKRLLTFVWRNRRFRRAFRRGLHAGRALTLGAFGRRAAGASGDRAGPTLRLHRTFIFRRLRAASAVS